VQHTIERDGFTVLESALSPAEVRVITSELETALEQAEVTAGPIRSGHELVAASRNLVQLWPGTLELARSTAIRRAVTEVLGPGCGLVRALYFDKPPGRSWSLPWHKDMTIAVRDNRRGGTRFSKPTVKAGVPHVEAPEDVLRQMITARAHLDDVNEENGPLLVIPGSHQDGKSPAGDVVDRPFHPMLVDAGDVLLIRPLVTHCSRKSIPGTARRRRVIHLEFATASRLPDGYEWHEFYPFHVAEDSLLVDLCDR
jgi:ectoine hydroxylase-related dioxygenase (phytanoyl-CoA dioxygenase family)